MGKTPEANHNSSTASHSSAPFFDRKVNAESMPSFFSSGDTVQTKLAIGKPDDALENEADQVADQVQAKLSVGAPDDPYEKEADQVADKVVSQVQGPSIQTKKQPSQRGRECEEGDYVFLKPAGIQRLGEDIDGNGSRDSIVAAAKSMIGKIQAKQAEGGQRVGAKHLLEIFHLAAPGVWDDSIVTTAGVKMPSWCGIFSVWAHKKAGKDIGTWQIGKGVSAFGTIQQTTSPQAGDIGYIDQPYQHHCIIVKIDGNNVHSIDGNSGLYSEVKETIRPMSAYSGFFTAFGAGSSVQRKKVQRKTNGETATVPASVEQSISSSKGKGNSLPGQVQQSMGSAMGADFGDVRVHADQSAADMNKALDAQAFTHGKDIYFNKDKYNPSSKEGQHLLAHELTHTIQQGAAAQRKMVQKNGNANTNKPAKKEFPKLDIPGRSLEIEEINLPDFKHRNKAKFKEPLLSLQPRPANLDQSNVWKFGADGKSGVKPDVDKYVETWLTGKMDKTQQGVYFLISKYSDFRLFGTMEEIQKECYIPKWDKAGQPCIHQVDHIVEMQLGGSNDPSNFELTEATANMSSGNSIKLERERRMNAALDKLHADPAVPKPMPPRSHFNTEYITSYDKVAKWNLPYKGKGHIFWTYDEIKKGDHMSRLRQMTPDEKKKSEGSKDDFVLYIRKGSGSPMRIKMNSINPDKEWIKGIQLTEFKIDKDTAANDEDYGYIKVKLSKRFKDLKADSDFTFRFKKMPYFFNTGYLVFDADKDQKFVNMLQFLGLSPIEIHEFRLDEVNGLVLSGNIITNIPIIDKTPIAISMIGDDFTVSKTFQLGDVKDKFPKPFKVNDVSLSIFASMKKGLGVEGVLDFEVDKIGKGQLIGLGSTFNGFGIEGSFEFDPDLFKSKIKASYKDKKFAFDGSVTMEKEKIPGVQSLTINVKYENEKLGGTGKAKLNIPGVKEIGIEVEQLETGGLKIAGDIEFGSKLKSDAKVQAVFEKGDAGWDVSIKGTLNPNIDIAGLKITKVVAGYTKGIFDVSAKVSFDKGKIKGEFDLGVSNSKIDEDGKKQEGIGTELAFYAAGEVSIDIVKDVNGKLGVKIKKDGDIIISGKVEVEKDKSIVDGKSANMNTDKSLKILEFGQKIPVASCGVASVVLELKAGVGLFYDFKGLTLDKGTNVTLEPVSLNDLDKAKVTSDISLSTGVKAGVDAFIEASAGLEVLIAGIKGKGRVNLKLTAFDATAKAKVGAGFSADKGLEFKTAEMEFDVKSKIGFDVDIGVEVYLNLLVTDVTLWEHTWKPESLKGEYEFSWFDGTLKVPLKFGENNSLKPEDVGSGLKGQMDEHAQDKEAYTSGAEDGINEKGPDPKVENAKTEKRIKDGVAIAYRGAHTKEVFAFNSTMSEEYFKKRVQSWKIVNEHKTLKSEIKEMLKKEIIQYEREEFDAFKKWLQDDTTFNADSKSIIINDFMAYRPTLDANDKLTLVGAANSSQLPDNSSTASSSATTSSAGPPSNNPLVLKKELPGDHGYAVPDDFAGRMQDAKANGLPLPLDVKADMGKEFGADFSKVRVHYDEESFALAGSVNAQAFTHENHIFFNRNKYEPATSEGRKLLAHELTHVLQQGHGETLKRIPERDATGTRFTGNYIFNPGHDGLNSIFFNRVKRAVADGNLSDTEIRALRKDAIGRNGSILHAELLLMAAMRNPVNVAMMQAHFGGALVLAMSSIRQADRDYIVNFDRTIIPPELANPYLRMLVAAMGLSGETLSEAINAMDLAAEQFILQLAGRQFSDEANRLIVSAGFTNPVIPLYEIVEAMVNGAADSTPGDQVMAGSVYLVARRFGHSTASQILNGTIKIDAMIPSVYRRLLGTGEAGYSYSTDQDIRKANMLYVPANIDILQLSHRALIIHELTHAEDDLARSTEQDVDSLSLESRAYVAQGLHMMEEIILAAPAPGFITSASTYVNLGPLYYWSMLLAAKRNPARYETIFINLCTAAPASKTPASVRTDLALTEAAITTNIRSALLALRTPGGQALYTAGNTTLGGSSGHFFQ